MSNIELFNDFYKKVFDNLNVIISNYNKSLLNRDGYLKENLSIFSNLNSNGKLVRGFLISLGYKLSGKEDIDYSYPLSLAYEIFQTSVLVHDDIIDEAIYRRGKETIHYVNYNKNKEFSNNLAKKLGDSIGICIGDYGFYEANKVIINNYKDDVNFSRILSYYNDN